MFRTLYRLRWIEDDARRGALTHEANKGEHYHDFAAHLNAGTQAVLHTNSRVEGRDRQPAARQYVILQTQAYSTRAI